VAVPTFERHACGVPSVWARDNPGSGPVSWFLVEVSSQRV